MTDDIQQLFDNNRAWSQQTEAANPGFFAKLSQQQAPRYLWIGCADSRVPANQIIDLLPGEVFVHRNVANLVVHSDLNCLSVIQYAVDVLQIRHIIVCGHYGCGGVTCAYDNRRYGLIDNWLRHIQDIHKRYRDRFPAHYTREQQIHILCKLNAIEQAYNVCQTTVVQEAWQRGQDLQVHGWVYSLQNGLIDDLEISVSQPDQIESLYQRAVERALAADAEAGG